MSLSEDSHHCCSQEGAAPSTEYQTCEACDVTCACVSLYTDTEGFDVSLCEPCYEVLT